MSDSPDESPSDQVSTWDKDDEDSGNGRTPPQCISLPVSQLMRVRSAPHLMVPDTEANVEAQAEDVFLNFVYQSYRIDRVRQETDSTPPVSELLNFTASPVTPAAEIGRQLARLGDDVNEKYADVFDEMITNLGFANEEAYDTFASIARRVFLSGINWGRIVILLSFGYRIAIRTLVQQTSNFAKFLARIVSFIVRFLVKERIAKWIADRGGWRAALTFSPGISTGLFTLISAMAALSVLAVYLHKYLQ